MLAHHDRFSCSSCCRISDDIRSPLLSWLFIFILVGICCAALGCGGLVNARVKKAYLRARCVYIFIYLSPTNALSRARSLVLENLLITKVTLHQEEYRPSIAVAQALQSVEDDQVDASSDASKEKTHLENACVACPSFIHLC